MEDVHDTSSIYISLPNQVFDIAFHPREDILYAGLLTGEIKAFRYRDEGTYEEAWGIRPTKRSCRGLATAEGGARLYGVTKDKSIEVIDTTTGKVLISKPGAHENSINRVLGTLPHQLATGDDEGVLRLWDTRTLSPTSASTHTYTHHTDFISDLLWLEDKKHLVCTSGDGTLSVLDVRNKKAVPWAQSEDQEDELLSVVPIKGGSKLVVGTQLGILHIFDRSKGYSDLVDRLPGHPSSVDALLPITDDVIATGSSDGMVRFVQVHPNKLLGVVVDHGEFPVERLGLDRAGKWLGSVGHEEGVRLTDVQGALEESDEEEGEEDKDNEREEEDEDEDEGEKMEKRAQMEEDEEDGTEMEADAPTPSEIQDSDEEMNPAPAHPHPSVSASIGRALEADSEEESHPRKKRKKKSTSGERDRSERKEFFSGL
ncbi:WD40 repeat-like protein [Dacryopinax primogenitus]|uniref:WD repeat-containing protein JIP5 n=1 Tax=Dacryopinax primogenitus (strain DJM 731) TaxID=1858805 RepID=M5G681_DACPD|nr:WD40 repeat-like protein [Dacryopinax primogenitus]EJU01342.1 WD40 repeat-like protein [Dacryopinax primogenitus]